MPMKKKKIGDVRNKILTTKINNNQKHKNKMNIKKIIKKGQNRKKTQERDEKEK